jgi:hypothetical protein
MTMTRTIPAVTLLATCLLGRGIVAEESVALEAAAASHMVERLLQAANTATHAEPLDTLAIEAAVELTTLATELEPSNADAWRMLAEVAEMADRPMLRVNAVRGLLAADPTDQAVQLARLRDAIDSLSTAPKRLETYERLLSPDYQSRLGPAISARIALDAALLQRRLGNIDQFARWLGEAVALDPSYVDAMAIAAGYFGDDTAGPFRQVELMTALMLANLHDPTSQVSLGEMLLSYGAYPAAERVLAMAVADRASEMDAVTNDVLADYAMAQWAAGDGPAALLTIRLRQQAIDEVFRKNIRAQQPRATPLQLARLHAPLTPKLATVRAAIQHDADPADARAAVDSAVDSFRTLAEIYKSAGTDSDADDKAAELLVQAAGVALLLDGDPDTAEELLQHATETVVLSEEARQRFDGWIAMRRGDLETAAAMLEPLAAGSDPAMVGMAILNELRGNEQEAAKAFLSVVRSQPGTMLGIWSGKQLNQLLGRRISPREESQSLNEMIAGIDVVVDEYPTEPREALTMRVEPLKATFQPYEPIIINVELLNNSVVPMAISESGPILPMVLIEPRMEITNTSLKVNTPIIVSIDRAIRLRPRERMSVRIDLRQQWIGGFLNQFPLRGGLIRMRVVSNFAVSQVSTSGGDRMVFKPGRLGVQAEGDQVRIDGVRLNDAWLSDTLDKVQLITDEDDLVALALLSWVVGDDVNIRTEPSRVPGEADDTPLIAPGDRHPLQDAAISAVLMAFPSLGPLPRAWFLSVMAPDPSLEAVFTMADQDTESVVRIGYLLRFLSPLIPDEALDDQRLLAFMQDDDDRVRRVAKWVYTWVQNLVDARMRRQLGGDGSPVSP